jgi:hypothetical protein
MEGCFLRSDDSMYKYKELEGFIGPGPIGDAWYDDCVDIARDILTEFSSEDWDELSNNILSKPTIWQMKLLDCLENEHNEGELAPRKTAVPSQSRNCCLANRSFL